MLPEEVRPAPGEGVYSWLIIPKAGTVPLCATVGEDVEVAQELPMNPTRGRHDTRQKGLCGARPL